MKNRLLALMALCTATSSTLPLWAADWADPKLTFVEPDLEGIKGGQKEVYYVYHVASEKSCPMVRILIPLSSFQIRGKK